ncbi:MAG: DUF1289 domain-containing protein [Proteobacteria bacterium]|nr:DUF1289 domain-containing protein [Pseudomonadota bacterium]
METPCIKVCTMDAASGLCTGCGRSLDEIARWGGMSDRERAEIMRVLPQRTRSSNQNKPVIPGELRPRSG